MGAVQVRGCQNGAHLRGWAPISLHTLPGASLCLLTFPWGWTWECYLTAERSIGVQLQVPSAHPPADGICPSPQAGPLAQASQIMASLGGRWPRHAPVPPESTLAGPMGSPVSSLSAGSLATDSGLCSEFWLPQGSLRGRLGLGMTIKVPALSLLLFNLPHNTSWQQSSCVSELEIDSIGL